jgi:hypothetical protein
LRRRIGGSSILKSDIANLVARVGPSRPAIEPETGDMNVAAVAR